MDPVTRFESKPTLFPGSSAEISLTWMVFLLFDDIELNWLADVSVGGLKGPHEGGRLGIGIRNRRRHAPRLTMTRLFTAEVLAKAALH